MAKIDISKVAEILKKNHLDPAMLRRVIEELNLAAQPDPGDEEKPPAVKKQHLFLVSDPEGKMPKADLVGWVLQIPENESPATTQDRLLRGVYDYNMTKKGQLYPAKTVGEALENVPAKFFKEADLWVRTSRLPCSSCGRTTRFPRSDGRFAIVLGAAPGLSSARHDRPPRPAHLPVRACPGGGLPQQPGRFARRGGPEAAELIRTRQREGRQAVLGLATGSTPVSFYAELVRLHREEGLSFANAVTFNLDEYLSLAPDHPQSYHRYMREHLFSHVDLPPAQAHLPDGSVAKAAIDAACAAYEEAIREAGGIDFQILGIGRTGHIGFNEPGSSRRSATRLVTLDPLTRRDAAGDFGGDEQTPHFALTMGVRTILSARRIVLMAWGQHKADIVRTAVENEVSTQVTASFLQEHDNATFVLDADAASALVRNRAPWQLGPLAEQGLAWDERMTRRAILWLAQQRKKAILKLTDDDYNEAGLQDLLRVHGSAYETNLAGFYQLQHTITGWPGGRDPHRTRPGDALVRPLRASSAHVYPKRVLVLSPHPDDDVISMGGTLCRLVDQGHEVHIAYEVSGDSAVPDEAVWRALAFVRDAGLAAPGREGADRDSGQGV